MVWLSEFTIILFGEVLGFNECHSRKQISFLLYLTTFFYHFAQCKP